MSYKDLKDLENNIKQQSEKIDTPDVYHKVKETPIRKLKKGQIAAKYISRKTGLAILAFLVLMVVIISVLCLALVLSDRTNNLEYSPVVATVTVSDGGVNTDYIFLCENNGTIKYSINATDKVKVKDTINLGLLSAIKSIKPESSTLTINIMSTSSTLMDNLYRELNSNLTVERATDSETLYKLHGFIISNLGENAIALNADLSSYYSKLLEISETKLNL